MIGITFELINLQFHKNRAVSVWRVTASCAWLYIERSALLIGLATLPRNQHPITFCGMFFK